MKREITADSALVAACGLYCGACGRYLKGKCPGCAENIKASWCAVRTCCKDAGRKSCADCSGFSDVKECGKFNNFVARVFGYVFNSDRGACINLIREKGYSAYVSQMCGSGVMTIKRKK